MKDIKNEQLKKQVNMYNAESVKYKLNKDAESKIIDALHFLQHKCNPKLQHQSKEHQEHRTSFAEIAPDLELIHFGQNKCKYLSKYKPINIELKAFIQLRHKVTRKPGCNPVYKSLSKANKQALIDIAFACKSIQVSPRLFSKAVQQPIEQEDEEDAEEPPPENEP